MKTKFATRALCLFLTVLLVGGSIDFRQSKADTSTAIYPIEVDVTFGQTEARKMLSMVNSFRTGSDAWYWDSTDTDKIIVSGLGELTYDYTLEKIAMQRAVEIALHFSHTRPDNTEPWTAYTDGYNAKAENIAAGYSDASKVFIGWCEEAEPYIGQGHRRNMLSSKVTAIGIGHVSYNGRDYWVQEFGNINQNATEVAANDSQTRVSVNVAESFLSQKQFVTNKEDYVLKCGETIELPEYQVRIQTAETWPESTVPVIPAISFSVDDTSCLTYANGYLTGVKAGTANLIVEYLGTTETIPVTVQDSSVTETEPPVVTVMPLPTSTANDTEEPTLTPSNPANATGEPSPTGSANATGKPSPTGSAIATGEPNPTGSANVTNEPVPTDTANVTNEPVPTDTANVTSEPGPTNTANVTNTPVPINPPIITQQPSPTSSIAPAGTSATVKTPAKAVIKSAKNKKGKKIAITVKAQSNISGYQVQYSTKSNMAGTKSKTSTKRQIVLTGLKKKKTYYIRVRAYTNVSGEKETGKWSTKVKVKVKK